MIRPAAQYSAAESQPNRSGYTLVEILVVVSIVLILFSMTLDALLSDDKNLLQIQTLLEATYDYRLYKLLHLVFLFLKYKVYF